MTTKTEITEVEDPKVDHYEPKPEGEKRFWKLHVINKIKDRNGNGDDVFNASKIKSNGPHTGNRLPGVTDKVFQDATLNAAQKVKKYVESRDLEEARGYKSPDLEANGYKFVSHMGKVGQGHPSTLYHHPELDKHLEIERAGDKFNFYSGRRGSKAGQRSHANLKDALEANKKLSEDSSYASSDNPALGAPSAMSGQMDTGSASAAKEEPKELSVTRESLEKIALQAAQIHDDMEEDKKCQPWVNAKLTEAQSALNEVAEYFKNGHKEPEFESEKESPTDKDDKKKPVKEALSFALTQKILEIRGDYE